MSFGALWRMAAQENVQHQLSVLDAESAAGVEFASEIDSVSDELADSDTIIANGLTEAEVEVLYAEVQEEADRFFGRYQDAIVTLRSQGNASPTRLEILQHISQHQTQINIVHLNSGQLNSLIDFFLDYASVSDDGTGEQISSTLTQSERETAEQRRAEILLEGLIMGGILAGKAKQEATSKKEQKDEKKRERVEHEQFVRKIVEDSKRNAQKAKKKKK